MPSNIVDIASKYLNGSLNAAKHDREHQKIFAMPTYASAAPNVMDREPLKDVFLGRYMVMGMRQRTGNRNWRFNPQYQRSGTCFLAGTGVLMEDGTEKPIESIVVGDRVRSHDGSVQSVIDTGNRIYSGKIHSLRLYGSTRALVATAEHPVYGAKRIGKQKKFRAADWHDIDSFGVKDRVFMPAGFDSVEDRVFDCSVFCKEDVVRIYKDPTVTENRCRVKYTTETFPRWLQLDYEAGFAVGLYAAEGCCDASRVTIAMHVREKRTLERFARFVAKAFNKTGSYTTRGNCMKYRVTSHAASQFFSMMVPGLAITKKVSLDVHTGSIGFKKGFLAGWFDGDGHLPLRRSIGIGITSSENLADDIASLSLAVGARCTVSKRRQAPHQNAPANEITFSGSSLGVVTETITERSMYGKAHVEVDGGFMVNVASNTSIDVVGVRVYNLEVENTHSYIVAGVAVHNCVGQGAAMAANVVMGINSFLEGSVFAGRASAGSIYAGSRVEIGKKPGSWEGSVGSWAADWVTKRGIVLMRDIGLDDSVDDPEEWLKIVGQDEKLGMQWTRSNSGVPSEYEQLATKTQIETTPLISTIAEARAAISNLTPIVLCGSVHPSKSRNANGASMSLERGGGHCTAIIGMRFDGREWWYDHLQSWWHYYTGGYARKNNPIDAMFSTSVTQIKESWLQRWLQEQDSYAYVGVQGLEPVQI